MRPGFFCAQSARSRAERGSAFASLIRALSYTNTICAMRHGTASPSTGVVKSITLERLLTVSTYLKFGSACVTGPYSSFCVFRLRKFGPLIQIRSTVPSVSRPAAFSAITRVTASDVSFSRT